MYETLYVNGDQFRGRELRIAKGESEGCDDISPVLFRLTYNGYGMRKFQRDRADEVNGKFYSCPLIRLPEIYLNIAEAMNELEKQPRKMNSEMMHTIISTWSVTESICQI